MLTLNLLSEYLYQYLSSLKGIWQAITVNLTLGPQ
jgi:hypothetical protein